MNFNTFQIITFGCKLNQYETQALTETLARQGKRLVRKNPEAVILNSCAVTHKAVLDLKKAVSKILKTNPKTKIYLTGCAAEVLKDQLKTWPGIEAIISQSQKFAFFSQSSLNNPFLPISDYFRARVVIKVQDGCSHFCTYCIVPFARGKPRSRSPQEVLAEIKRLQKKGFTEFILSGINLHQYGLDFDRSFDFWDLVDFLDQQLREETIRIRLSSLEPSDLNQKALTLLQRSKLICPHLHVSLQSGATRILQKMNRCHYLPRQLLEFIQELKKIWPIFGLGLDVLIGFPGETDEDFEQTLALLEQLPLSYAHLFTYSPRPKTKAANFQEQVSPSLKQTRWNILKKLVSQKQLLFVQKIASLPVLNVIPVGQFKAMSEYYLPVYLDPNNPLPTKSKQIIPVKPLQLTKQKPLPQVIVRPIKAK